MGRSVAKVLITQQTVVELAKDALVPIRCDAPPMPSKSGETASSSSATKTCGLELSSWRLLFRHQYKKHGIKRKGGAFAYTCGLSRCSAHLHQDQEAFKKHVKTHMKTVALPCPFANCKPHIPEFGRPTTFNMFLKEKDLIDHLETHHADLIGSELDPRSELLLPSWEPRPPCRPLVPPPDLPRAKFHRLHYVSRRPGK
ncbi:hypothetical protein K438DRAFT_779169 [Mycena galopus ATCC 62051]|nr:hypothetical protein K438DRAFT_779169 [Mycena galopus ATCC 62051]